MTQKCDRCGDEIPPGEGSFRGAYGYRHLCVPCYVEVNPAYNPEDVNDES